ncbi:HK97 family phage prohead protease [Sporomusaceae bacterium BoRhaA]|uniref:prohead protease/major capsid protein fusion protein n=1 Tax=Pelorhabdus rhamnosifermentans TaxID=2772457 RepID=UPI001C06061D|nr:prohead protease/major capsid protein fusion protein [Pelorhabdus rhamnosifermentans]MBU2701680.1 HK97 family phage prohead protease [Pelorhabdus rhamnosifermentans]
MKNKNSRMFRELMLDRAQMKDDRTVELSFSSEAPYERWFGNEILSHDPGAVDLSRLQEIGVLLFNHNANMPIGQVLSVELDEAARKCKATVRFDTDEQAETIYQKVQSGTLKGVSVGYQVMVWEEVGANAMSTNGRFAGPCSVAVKWMPYEISIVSVPADPDVGVGRSADPQNQEEGETRNMKTDGKQNAPAVPPVAENQERGHVPPIAAPVAPPAAPNVDDAVQRALSLERARVAEIGSMCRSFGIDPQEHIDAGKSVDEVRKIVLEKAMTTNQPTKISVGVEDVEKFRSAAVDGLAMRAGMTLEKPVDGAKDFRGMSMLRLAQECIERQSGKDMRFSDNDTLIREALTGSGAFPGILSNVANKSMAQAYQTAPTTFQLWTAKGSNSDFKDATRYRLSEADELVEIKENGEFKDSTFTEAKAKASIGTYGRKFGISRKAIINDDLGALNRIPALYGAAARRMINRMVYKILTDNPTIENAALFHANHKNMGAGVINVENLGKAKAAMAKQKNIGGKEALNIQPAFLIVPVDLETIAAQLISSVVDPSKNNATPNPFANKLSVVSDPTLEDAVPWYLAAAPGMCPSIEVTYLNGVDQPTMESTVLFDMLGIKWRIFHDFGVNLIDYRGLYKSTGIEDK